MIVMTAPVVVMRLWTMPGRTGERQGRVIDSARVKVALLGVRTGDTMSDDMGSVRADVQLENPTRPGERRTVQAVRIDTGADLSWFPSKVLESLGVERMKVWRFRQVDGSVLERWTGEVRLYAADAFTIDEVVFGQPSDLILLGSRSLEGLNLMIDPVAKRLVDAGPASAACVAAPSRSS